MSLSISRFRLTHSTQRISREMLLDLVINAQENGGTVSSWRGIDYWQRILAHRRLNEELHRQGLPEINESVYNWRMARALAHELRKPRKSQPDAEQSQSENALAAGEEEADAETNAQCAASQQTTEPL